MLLFVFLGALGAFAVWQSVAEGAEPFIERDAGLAVVAFEIAMMQVMEIGSGRPFFLNDRPFESVMAASR